MKCHRILASALGLSAILHSAARADQCTALMATTTTMCLTAIYSAHPVNKFTVTFGPGTGFSGSGASRNAKGITFQGSYACQGNDFYTTAYAVSDGEQNYWIGRFPDAILGGGSLGIYFSGKLKPGACP